MIAPAEEHLREEVTRSRQKDSFQEKSSKIALYHDVPRDNVNFIVVVVTFLHLFLAVFLLRVVLFFLQRNAHEDKGDREG